MMPIKSLLMPLAAILAVLSSGCIVRETVTEHGEVVSDRLEVKAPFEKKPEPTL